MDSPSADGIHCRLSSPDVFSPLPAAAAAAAQVLFHRTLLIRHCRVSCPGQQRTNCVFVSRLFLALRWQWSVQNYHFLLHLLHSLHQLLLPHWAT